MSDAALSMWATAVVLDSSDRNRHAAKLAANATDAAIVSKQAPGNVDPERMKDLRILIFDL